MRTLRRPGRWQLQAAIAACHADAETAAATDWPQVLVLYDLLLGYELGDHWSAVVYEFTPR